MINRVLIIIIFSILWVFSEAQDVKFTMSAPNAVEMGKQFRLSFTLSGNSRGSNLKLPDLNNFQVLMGPSTSQFSNIQIINGQTTTESSYSYMYILQPRQEGTFEIRPGSIEVDGKVYESNSLKIQVVKSNPNTQQNQQGSGQPRSIFDDPIDEPAQKPQVADLGKDNLFLRLELSKGNVYKGEQLIATVKLYVNPELPVAGFDEVNLPTYEGFYTQDIEIPQQINFTREVYNDRIYSVGVLKKTILFPQKSGSITINPFNMSLLVQQRVRPRSLFDDFFSGVRTVKAPLTSAAVRVNVKDLPPAPSGFVGGVGNFDVKSEISGQDVTTNDAVTLKVTISGSGNLRLIQNPELKLPADFEIYDPKATDNVNASGGGLSGSKTIEYLFQPRFAGEYTIPSLSLAFFNPSTGSYITKTTPEYKLKVKKGTGEQSQSVVSSTRKEDVQMIGKDIRFIKQGNAGLSAKGHTFFGTFGFYFIYLILALAFIGVYLVFQKKARENADIAFSRNKKANRVAQKRLKAASVAMKENNNEQFHDSLLKAFWGYLSDKLSIPVADLNRETASEALLKKGIDQNIIHDFVSVIDQCEFARYAPNSGSQARTELYNKAEETMSLLEKQIKN